MFAQAIASVFSSQGVIAPHRYRPARAAAEERLPLTTRISQESAVLQLSPQARQLLAGTKARGEDSGNSPSERGKEQPGTAGAQQEFSEEEKEQVKELQKRDQEVRAHEQAHISAGGSIVKGGAQFEYENGPDGKRYAVGGEVKIDTSREQDDPDANLGKAQLIRKAALAPADPSAQDRSVAAEASRMESEARMEKARMEQGQPLQARSRGNEDQESFLKYRNGEDGADARISGYGRMPAGNAAGSLINLFA